MSTPMPPRDLIDDADVQELARKICSIPTQANNERQVADVLAGYLDRPGVDVHVEDLVDGRANVIAIVKGAGDRAPLVLNGHLDASIADGWSHDAYDPWLADGRLHGAGITDMKGAVAAMAAAVGAAPSLDRLPGDLIFQGVMHHDTIGLGTKFALASEGPSIGFGICGEPSGLAVHTGNAGAAKFEILFEGATAHVSRMEDGRDALRAAVRVYDALVDAEFPHAPCDRLPELPRLLIGQLHAGANAWGVPADAVLRGDLRTVPGMDRHAVRAALEDTVGAHCPSDIGWKIRLTAVQRPFMGATDGPLVESLMAAHEAVFGSPPRLTSELPGQAFVTDAADMSAAGLDTVVYGVGEWHHLPDQAVSVAEMADSARVYLAVAASALA